MLPLSTVDEYLQSLPGEHRAVLSAVRDVVLRHLPKGFQESMTWGVPTYEVPLERYPHTYNGKPLGYAALAAKKNYYTLHLVSVYADPAALAALQDGFARRGKKLDMGKGCVRFKRLDDLPLDVIAEIVGRTSVDQYVARIEAGQRQRAAGKAARKTASSGRGGRPAPRKAAAPKRPPRKTTALASRRKRASRAPARRSGRR